MSQEQEQNLDKLVDMPSREEVLKRPLLESQRRAIVDFLKPKAEFVKSSLIPTRPSLEKLNASALTIGGGYLSLDGLIDLIHYVQSWQQLDETSLITVGSHLFQGLVGLKAVAIADEWKKNIWQRENNIPTPPPN